jgi:hypothetical protein
MNSEPPRDPKMSGRIAMIALLVALGLVLAMILLAG